MRKIEEILKARNWSDEDIKALEPMLTNAKFRDTLESEIANQEFLVETANKDAAETLRWRTEEALPKLQQHMDSERAARAELAAKNEQLRVLQEQGLIKLEELNNNPPKETKPADAFDPKAHNLVTLEDVGKFAEAEGQAIVTVNDLAAEYQDLFGKSIFSYVSPTGARGMRALREEAKANKVTDLAEFVSKKFDFAGKRAEVTRKNEEEREKAIRADERAKIIAESANPNLRPHAASLSPFTRVKRDDKDSMPWENAEERRAARVEKVAKAELLRA